MDTSLAIAVTSWPSSSLHPTTIVLGLYVGCEGDESNRVGMIRMVGHEPFMYSSDFPHEANSEYCKHEIEEFIENEELSEADREGVLHGNAERFYRLNR